MIYFRTRHILSSTQQNVVSAGIENVQRELWTNLIGQRQQVVIKQDRACSQCVILRKHTVINLVGVTGDGGVMYDTLNAVLAGAPISAANERYPCGLELTDHAQVE